MAIRSADVNNWFTHHPPRNEHEVECYQAILEQGKAFAETIVVLTPAGADQSAAIRKIREAVMTANAAIACDGAARGELRQESAVG